MTVYNVETGKALKHYAFDKINNARYFVIALENETDRTKCSVIDMDSLESSLLYELTEFINGDVCQHSWELWRELDKKMFMDYPNHTMLQVLKSKRKIKVVPQDQVVIQMPNEENKTAKEVMDGIRAYQATKQKSFTLDDALHRNDPTPAPAPVASDIESKNAKEIDELKESIKNVNSQLADITSSIASLVDVLKSNSKKKTEK